MAHTTPEYERRTTLLPTIMMIIITAVLVVDISLSFVPDLQSIPGSWTNATFVVLVSIFAIGQFIVIRYIEQLINKGAVRARGIKIFHKVTKIVQYVLAAVLVFTALQLLLTSEYSTVILQMGSSIAYGLSVAVMAFLSFLFLSWYRSNKNLVVFSYGVSSAIVCISLSLLIAQNYALLSGLPAERDAQSEPNLPFPNDIMYLTALSSAVSFFLLWFSTALLLHHYSSRIGRAKFWLIMGAPIFSFVIQFSVLPQITAAYANPYTDMLYLVLLGNVLPAVTTGILFGVPFWIISRTIRNEVLRRYMSIAAWGSALLQLSSLAGIYLALYPPFGLYGSLSTGLACYLILVGIYSSALMASIDRKLRLFIKKNTIERTMKLINVIGEAEMKKEIEGQVLQISQKYVDKMTDETGMPSSITQQEIEKYVETAIEEVRNSKSLALKNDARRNSKADSLAE